MSLFTDADIAAFKSQRLVRAMDLTGVTDDFLLEQLKTAETDIARQLKVLLEPTTIFPGEPSEEEIAALPSGMAWAEEPGYDYDADFFRDDKWGYLVLMSRPVISVESIRFAYPQPDQTFWEIPDSWIRLDKKPGVIRLVPAAQTITVPLSVFMMQVMGGGRSIPFMIQVKYVAGLTDAREKWRDLVDVIYKMAALNMIEGEFRPQSGSISGDGLSESESFDPEKMRDLINVKLFGPKGSNGGLWTAIHGIGGSVLGSLA
jgi:hypothetical protein